MPRKFANSPRASDAEPCRLPGEPLLGEPLLGEPLLGERPPGTKRE
jgi:hypothetical protein